MSATFKQLTDFLVNLGIEEIPHTQKNYLAHLVSVYKLMQASGCDEEVCRAGLFHSIYGTEKFQGFKLPLERRAELAELIGSRAERLAYWNCLMDRASLDELVAQEVSPRSRELHTDQPPRSSGLRDEPLLLRNRETGEMMPLTRRELDDLCCVHLFDWLEQAPRSRFGMDYRREAYRQMAERLGERAIQAYEKVFPTAVA